MIYDSFFDFVHKAGTVLPIVGFIAIAIFSWVTRNADEELRGMMSEALGMKKDTLAGLPVKYKYDPANEAKGIPFALDIQFTVKNPLNIRMAIHKAGPLSRPVGLLPPELPILPGWVESPGFTLRSEPIQALDGLTGKLAVLTPFLNNDLEILRLEGNEFKINILSWKTYDLEDVKKLLDIAAQAALLFN